MIDEPIGDAQAITAEPSPPPYVMSRELIADRTGELLSSVIGLAEEYIRPQAILMTEPGTGINVPVIMSREGLRPVPSDVFDDYRDNPKHRRGTATMTRLESFIGHVNRFKNPESAVFACDDRVRPSLTAVLDYHDAEASGGMPQFGHHRTHYAFPLSDEWKAWQAMNKKAMGMAEFAEFLEERIVDVEDVAVKDLSEGIQRFIGSSGNDRLAGPTRLMQVATGLRVNEASTVASTVNLSSGEGQIMFQSEHQDETGGKLLMPNLFIVTIPVFAHDGAYRIAARLRSAQPPAPARHPSTVQLGAQPQSRALGEAECGARPPA